MKRQDTLSTFQFHEMYPTEEAAVNWFEGVRWRNGRFCPHCGSANTIKATKPQPYRCKDCRKHFSCRTGTIMQSSKLPVKKWLYAMFLMSVSRKGISSLQLARELGVAQEAAWRLGHKIRAAWNQGGLFAMAGPVEVDETYMGGKEKNKHTNKKLRKGRGTTGKIAIAGIKDRATGQVVAKSVNRTDAQTLQPFVLDNTLQDVKVYTDEAYAYRSIDRDHETVRHSASEYVRGEVHTNAIESFWALLKRAHKGTFHCMSEKHIQRSIDEFQNKQNEGVNALEFMLNTSVKFEGRLLTHRQLVDGV